MDSEPCEIEVTISRTFSETFGTQVDLGAEKDVVRAGASFVWQRQTANATGANYHFPLESGRQGFVAFHPYYQSTSGYLRSYIVGPGYMDLIDEHFVTSTSPMKKTDGYAYGAGEPKDMKRRRVGVDNPPLTRPFIVLSQPSPANFYI